MSASVLFKHSSPVKSIDSSGAFTINRVSDNEYGLTPTNSAWGRATVSVLYEDGKTQAVHYFITKPAPQAVSDLGSFFTSKAHLQNTSDPFHRAPSIMTYDREEDAIVEQDERVWIAGISDEGGTGAYIAAAMKQYMQPVVDEVKILDDFIY